MSNRVIRAGAVVCATALSVIVAVPALAQRQPAPIVPAPVTPAQPSVAGSIGSVPVYLSGMLPPACPPATAAAPDDRLLPPNARGLIERYAQAWADAEREVFERLSHERDQLIRDLQDVQDEETRAGHLDEALAVREHLRQLQASPMNPVSGPTPTTGCGAAPMVFTIAPVLTPGQAPQTPRSPASPIVPQAPSTARTPKAP